MDAELCRPVLCWRLLLSFAQKNESEYCDHDDEPLNDAKDRDSQPGLSVNGICREEPNGDVYPQRG